MNATDDPTPDPAAPAVFRLGYVPGVTPGKWVRIWRERYPRLPLELVSVEPAEAPAALRGRRLDAGFVRLPIDRTDLHAIPLYTETTVVVVPKDHLFAAADTLSAEDLADELALHPLDDTLDWAAAGLARPPGRPALERPATTEDAVQLVAAGVGVLAVPQSLARLHHRKDLTYRPVTGLPESQLALAWPEEATTDRVEDFIGIVRGRTANSSRGRRTEEAAKPEKSGKPARAKAAGSGTAKGGGGGGAKGVKGAKGKPPAAKRAGGANARKGTARPRRRPS
ncbi:LysR family substrate-binding domain-containing protein [Streptomyces polyrhachis]|uniref:LysR family substrate-binding domain-containing protein n=1 Tax=Streptomyces polyrhachis TaxID=1282885 RepID=A0ABW2GI95_9ACTN